MKFYLKTAWDTEWREVPQELFVKAERAAGFRPKGEDVGQPATAGFSSGSVSGRVEYIKDST